MRVHLMGLAAALSLAGAVSAQAGEAAMTAAQARAIVEARNAQFEALFAADDPAGLATQMYTRDGRLVPPDAPDMVGPAAITAYWTGATAAIASVDVVTDEALPVGPGYIAERSHVTLFGADGAVLGGGKAVILWALEDGVWKMHWDGWNNGPVE